MYDRLRVYEEELLQNIPNNFKRSIYGRLEGHDRLIGIVGANGMGKTTLLLQRAKDLKEEHGNDKVLYMTLDYPFVANIDLVEFAEELHGYGVRYLLIDEIHKHPFYQKMLKAIYDTVLGMQIIFAGSGAMDTSRLGSRLTLLRLQGMSFRELMSLGKEKPLPHYDLLEILEDHQNIAKELSSHFDIAKGIRTYLRRGYYPGHTNSKNGFIKTMLDSLNDTLDRDLVSSGLIEQKYTYKMKRVLEVLSTTNPGKINLSTIAEESEISRVKLYDYLNFMESAGVVRLVSKAEKDAKQKAKPARVYIDNTNLRIFYNPKADINNIRETFFVNQVGATEKVSAAQEGYFVVNGKWRFQLSKPKDKADIFEERKNAFSVVDTLISDHPNKIPLWIFGFLY